MGSASSANTPASNQANDVKNANGKVSGGNSSTEQKQKILKNTNEKLKDSNLEEQERIYSRNTSSQKSTAVEETYGGHEEEHTHQEKTTHERNPVDYKRLQNELKNKVRNFTEYFEKFDLQMEVLWTGDKKLNPEMKVKDRNKFFQSQNKLVLLQQEKSRHLTRLSSIASARLRHNNPDIADLSDENRATKLAEKLSELYDNEWTDVFEATKKRAVGNVNDTEVALNLRDILKFCYNTCEEIARDQRKKILRDLIPNVATEEKGAPADTVLALKELQKELPEKPMEYVVKKKILAGLQKKQKEQIVLNSLKTTEKPLHAYVILCTKVAWLLQIQDPPLVLDFEGSANPTGLFRPYTVSGMHLEYVLWPALLLQENGPIVSKGVAQFSKEPPNVIDSTVSGISCEPGPSGKTPKEAISLNEHPKTGESDWN